MMKRIFAIVTMAILAVVVPVQMLAQDSKPVTAKQLAGTWRLVSTTLEQDGKKTDLFGPNPRGIMILGRDGHFARVVTRSDLPKFASNDRLTGTPEENKTAVQGGIGYFGTYSCDTADKSCTLHVEGSTFPNWAGADQKRPVTLAGDELRETVLVPRVQVVWKRDH